MPRSRHAISTTPPRIANDIVAGHNDGEPEALNRLTEYVKAPIPLTQEMLQARARGPLGRPETSTEPITIDDALYFVALQWGFDSWKALEEAFKA